MRRTPSSSGASSAHPNRGAAHTRVTRRLTGTITQDTVCQPGGQNSVRHDESRLTGPHMAVGLHPVYALPDLLRPGFLFWVVHERPRMTQSPPRTIIRRGRLCLPPVGFSPSGSGEVLPSRVEFSASQPVADPSQRREAVCRPSVLHQLHRHHFSPARR